MIVIRWTPPFDLDISGAAVELREVMSAISSVASGQRPGIDIDADSSADARPYSKCLLRLTVNGNNGPTKVSVADDSVSVIGSAHHLKVFASYFNMPEDSPRSPVHYHHHFEYFEGDDRMTPDSIPLVISVA